MLHGHDVLASAKCLEVGANFAYKIDVGGNASNTRWSPIPGNPNIAFQTAYMEAYENYLTNASSLPEMLTKADVDVNAVNTFLRDNKFGEIQLQAVPNTPFLRNIYMAALYRLIVKYLEKGDEFLDSAQIKRRLLHGKPAFRLDQKTKSGKVAVRFYDLGYEYPVVVISTQMPTDSLVVAPSKTPMKGLALTEFARTVQNQLHSKSPNDQVTQYGGVVMPNVRFKREIEEGGYFVNMQANFGTNTWRISQSKVAVEFLIGPEGAQSGAAAAMAATSFSIPVFREDLEITYDSIAFINRQGMTAPTATLYFTGDSTSETTVTF